MSQNLKERDQCLDCFLLSTSSHHCRERIQWAMWPDAKLIGFEQALLGAVGARGWAGIPPEPPRELAHSLQHFRERLQWAMWPVADLIAFEQALLGALGARDGHGVGGDTPRTPQGTCSQAKKPSGQTWTLIYRCTIFLTLNIYDNRNDSRWLHSIQDTQWHSDVQVTQD